MNTIDKIYIRRCFELALKGAGYVSPNPLVGCVIVKNGFVVSEGSHQEYGGPHAEADAIAKAKISLEGTTLFCNLEPCCHTDKQTPPCVPKIIECGVKRVVISNIDPNPKVAGRGIEMLRANGIEVETGVLEEAGCYINRFFFKNIQTGLPYVTLKIAQSKDGFITSEEGKQTFLTGKESAEYVHTLRARYDAVLVGANTVNVDNPQLNVRYAAGRNPKRIIIDGRLSSNTDAKVFNDENRENTILLTSSCSDNSKLEIIKNKGVSCFTLPADENGLLSIAGVLKKLGEDGITSLFVEGGAMIFSQFIKENLFDELIILTSPHVLGSGIMPHYEELSQNLKEIEENTLGADNKSVYLNCPEAF